MKHHDLIELAARNLRESMLRNSLTTLGIGVGVASMVAMLSLGVGLQDLFSKRMNSAGIFDTVIVYSRRDFRGFSKAERGATTAEARTLDEAARRELQQIPKVLDVTPQVRFQAEVRFDNKPHFASLSGLPASAKTNEAFEEIKGKWFSGLDVDEAIIHMEFAKDLTNKPESLIGKSILLRYAERQMVGADGPAKTAPASSASTPAPAQAGAAAAANEAAGVLNQERLTSFSVVRREKPLRVVGIIEREPFGGWLASGGGRVFIPIALAEKLERIQYASLRDALRRSEQRTAYGSLQVRVAKPTDVQPVQEAIRKMGFATWSIMENMRNMRRAFAVLDLLLGVFGSLALAVASLGIMNTLVMAILERRREIGIMKALGASDSDVKKLFFAEAGVMGLTGGVLGVLLGWAIGRAINFGTEVYARQQQLPVEDIWSVKWWLVLGAIGFAVLVSLGAGLYPAARAAKLDPVQALRYE